MKEILREGINNIDDSFIDEALEYKTMQKRNKKWKSVITVAACFVMVVAIVPVVGNILNIEAIEQARDKGKLKEINKKIKAL